MSHGRDHYKRLVNRPEDRQTMRQKTFETDRPRNQKLVKPTSHETINPRGRQAKETYNILEIASKKKSCRYKKRGGHCQSRGLPVYRARNTEVCNLV